MITRIVKMTFEEGKIPVFLDLINEINISIRSFPGCLHLEVLQDPHQPQIFFTYSKWESEQDLNKYRDSELFKSIWPKTKILFKMSAEAWTLNEIKFSL